jgi:hypothetical protein
VVEFLNKTADLAWLGGRESHPINESRTARIRTAPVRASRIAPAASLSHTDDANPIADTRQSDRTDKR